MTIAIVAGFCVLLLILAFLVPRLSHGPERGGSKVAGAPTKATSKAPGKLGHWLSKPFNPQEREHGPQGPLQDAVLALGALDRQPREQAVEAARQPPVALADQVHRGRD